MTRKKWYDKPQAPLSVPRDCPLNGWHERGTFTVVCQHCGADMKASIPHDQPAYVLVQLVDALKAAVSELPDRCEHEREMAAYAIAKTEGRKHA